MPSLRSQVIRLANSNSALRPQLLPLLQREAVSVKVAGRFPLGRTVMTRSVAQDARQSPELAMFVQECLQRHGRADWGDVKGEDRRMNDDALKKGQEDRILSVYKNPGGDDIWIITEWDRSATTVMYPSDY